MISHFSPSVLFMLPFIKFSPMAFAYGKTLPHDFSCFSLSNHGLTHLSKPWDLYADFSAFPSLPLFGFPLWGAAKTTRYILHIKVRIPDLKNTYKYTFKITNDAMHLRTHPQNLNPRLSSGLPFRNPSQFLMSGNLHFRVDSLKLVPLACAYKFCFSSTWLPMSGTPFLSIRNLPGSSS